MMSQRTQTQSRSVFGRTALLALACAIAALASHSGVQVNSGSLAVPTMSVASVQARMSPSDFEERLRYLAQQRRTVEPTEEPTEEPQNSDETTQADDESDQESDSAQADAEEAEEDAERFAEDADEPGTAESHPWGTETESDSAEDWNTVRLAQDYGQYNNAVGKGFFGGLKKFVRSATDTTAMVVSGTFDGLSRAGTIAVDAGQGVIGGAIGAVGTINAAVAETKGDVKQAQVDNQAINQASAQLQAQPVVAAPVNLS